MDSIIKFNTEQDTKKFFEAIVADGGEEVDRRPRLMRAVFYDVPKILYNTYTFSPRQGSIHDQAMSKLKGKRTGVQPHYHEKHMVIRQGGFGGILNFDNAGTQIEWIIISTIPVLSKEHRNMYSVYNNDKATHIIQKNNAVKYERFQAIVQSKVYDLTQFDDQLSLYREFRTCISNKSSTSTMLHFSSNQEIQDTVERREFFTNQCSKMLFIDMRDSLRVTGRTY